MISTAEPVFISDNTNTWVLVRIAGDELNSDTFA